MTQGKRKEFPIKSLKVRPSTYAIMQLHCAKKQTYADFIHNLIVEKFGSRIPTEEEVLTTK